MTLAYATKLGLKIWFTNNRAQKIDGFTLERFEIVLASFQIKHKLKRARFFQKTVFVLNTNIMVILSMLSFILSNSDILFVKQELI